MVFQRSFKGVSRKFKKRFNRFSTVLQGKLKDVLGDSRRFKVIQGSLKGILKKFKRCFKGVSKVSSVFQENLKNFQECFIEVLSNLFSHGTHQT